MVSSPKPAICSVCSAKRKRVEEGAAEDQVEAEAEGVSVVVSGEQEILSIGISESVPREKSEDLPKTPSIARSRKHRSSPQRKCRRCTRKWDCPQRKECGKWAIRTEEIQKIQGIQKNDSSESFESLNLWIYVYRTIPMRSSIS